MTPLLVLPFFAPTEFSFSFPPLFPVGPLARRPAKNAGMARPFYQLTAITGLPVSAFTIPHMMPLTDFPLSNTIPIARFTGTPSRAARRLLLFYRFISFYHSNALAGFTCFTILPSCLAYRFYRVSLIIGFASLPVAVISF